MEAGAEGFEEAVFDFPGAEVRAGDADQLVGGEEVGSGTGVGNRAIAGGGAVIPVARGPVILAGFTGEVEAWVAYGVTGEVDLGSGGFAESDDGEPVVWGEAEFLEVEVFYPLDVLLGGLEHLGEALVGILAGVLGVEAVDAEVSLDTFEDGGLPGPGEEQVGGEVGVGGDGLGVGGEEVVEGWGDAGYFTFTGGGLVATECGMSRSELEHGFGGAVEGGAEGGDLVDVMVPGVVVEVVGDDETAHGMADEIDAWGFVVIGGVVVFQESGAIDDFEDELPQLGGGVLEGLSPVIGEGEDGCGEVGLWGEVVAEFFDEVGVDELEYAIGLQAGGLACFIAWGIGVGGDAGVVAGPEVIDWFGGGGVLVLEFAAHDTGDEHDGVWGLRGHGGWDGCRDFDEVCQPTVDVVPGSKSFDFGRGMVLDARVRMISLLLVRLRWLDLGPLVVGLTWWVAAGEQGGGGGYRFDRTISRGVLENYLARSITMEGLLNGRGDLGDNIRMLDRLGAKFIGRALCLWGGEERLLENLARARGQAALVLAGDPERVMQACIFEIVTTQVDGVPVPEWAFRGLGLPVEERNFRYGDMLYPGGEFVDHWRAGQSVPDISRVETQLYFYFLGASFIDVGCEAIHLGQTELMNRNDRELEHYGRVLELIRGYAARNARRRMVILDSHVPSGGLVRDGRLLMDFHSFPLRIKEVAERPQEAVLELGFSDGIYLRSKGGRTFSGWDCDHLPYLVEIDNWGVSRQPGQAGAGSIWIWGYDEITWFAQQDGVYRSNWLHYAHDWVRSTDTNGFLQMPGSRTMRSPLDGRRWYHANDPSVKVPEGMGDEAAILSVWSGVEVSE
ncbi:MAG: hypothetical protein RI897_3027 [Verrucomicrobiota bacterium]